MTEYRITKGSIEAAKRTLFEQYHDGGSNAVARFFSAALDALCVPVDESKGGEAFLLDRITKHLADLELCVSLLASRIKENK